MEKMIVEPYDMEYMKMALLKHEETFKQQVYELHRLYEIQRMLMKKMQRSMQNTTTSWSLIKNGNIIYDQKQDQDDDDGDADDDDDDEMEEESEIELTLGPTTRYSKKKKKKGMLYNNNNWESSSGAGLGMFSSSSSSNHKTTLVTLQNSGVVLLLDSCTSTACT